MSETRSRRSRLLSIALGVILLTAVGGLVFYVVVPVPAMPPDTEFYVLNSGTPETAYPTNLSVGESATVTATVENQEYEAVSYELAAVHDDERFVAQSKTIPNGEMWTRNVTISFEEPGKKQVDLFLYRDGDTSEPYRRLYLRFNVTQEP